MMDRLLSSKCRAQRSAWISLGLLASIGRLARFKMGKSSLLVFAARNRGAILDAASLLIDIPTSFDSRTELKFYVYQKLFAEYSLSSNPNVCIDETREIRVVLYHMMSGQIRCIECLVFASENVDETTWNLIFIRDPLEFQAPSNRPLHLENTFSLLWTKHTAVVYKHICGISLETTGEGRNSRFKFLVFWIRHFPAWWICCSFLILFAAFLCLEDVCSAWILFVCVHSWFAGVVRKICDFW